MVNKVSTKLARFASNCMGMSKFEKGVGLVEVLIAMLVVSAGLLTVAKFQSSITQESRENKARAEALAYCQDGINLFRTPITQAEFNILDNLAATENDPEATRTGTTETYSRSFQVTTQPSGLSKIISATCSWPQTDPSDPSALPIGSVTLSTEVALHSAVSGALSAGVGGTAGAGLSPSLNANSSDEAAIIRVLSDSEQVAVAAARTVNGEIDTTIPVKLGDEVTVTNSEGEEVTGFYFADDSGTTASFGATCANADPDQYFGTSEEGVLAAKRINFTGNAGYLEAIKLYQVETINEAGSDTDYCIDRVRYNGGVILRIEGSVHSNLPELDNGYLPLELFTFNISESGTYCTFNPEVNDTSRQYKCYVGGNCSTIYPNPTDGQVDDADVFKCPATAPSDAGTTVANEWGNVGPGGWRGRVGLLNVANYGYNACFYEELYTDTDSSRDTARDYYTRYRGLEDNLIDDRNQGINKSYSCQDFFIIDGVNSPLHSALRKACKSAAETMIGSLYVASKTTARELGFGEENTFDPIEGANCNRPYSYTIEGVFTSTPVGLPDVRVVESGQTSPYWLCEVSSTGFSCSVTTIYPDLILEVQGYQGTSADASSGCSIDLTDHAYGDTITGCELTFSTSTPKHQIIGALSGSKTGTNLDTLGGIESITIETTDGYIYGCPVSTYDSASGIRPFICEFVNPAPGATSLTSLFISTNAGYSASPESLQNIDLVNDDSNTTTISSPFFITDPGVTNTWTLSGNFTLIAGVGSNPSINPDGNSVFNGCSLTPPGQNWNPSNSNRVGTYSCTLAEGDRDVTISIADTCEGDNGQNVGTKVAIDFDGVNTGFGTYTYSANVQNDYLNADITISVSDEPCN